MVSRLMDEPGTCHGGREEAGLCLRSVDRTGSAGVTGDTPG